MHDVNLRKEIEIKRLEGISAEELAQMYSVPRGTVYQWVRNLTLSSEARSRLESNSILGSKKGRETSLKNKQLQELKIRETVVSELATIQLPISVGKLLCAFLYWAEGAKDREYLTFINSDPKMIHTFLYLFRRFFKPDETKFRVLVHLHPYHNPSEILSFWATTTKIPLSQFNKPYLKKNSGINKKDGYQGCISVRYYDAKIAKEIFWLYTTFSSTLGA